MVIKCYKTNGVFAIRRGVNGVEIKLDSITKILKYVADIEIYICEQEYPIIYHYYNFENDDKIDDDYDTLLTLIMKLTNSKVSEKCLTNGMCILDVEQEKKKKKSKMIFPGDNCLAEWIYDAEEECCRLGWTILKADSVKNVKKVMPATLCIESICNDKMYWVFSDDRVADEKYKEIVEAMNR
jgi:hypothetical protein